MGFGALGVWSTVVHSAARLSSSFFSGTALAVGATKLSVTAAIDNTAARRDMTTL